MAFCKVCSCGNKIVFQTIMGYPEFCPECGRRCSDFDTLRENDPMVEYLIKQASPDGVSSPSSATPVSAVSPASAPIDSVTSQVNPNGSDIPSMPTTANVANLKYSLKLENGAVIEIPPEGGIIGRTELGGEQLAEFGSVSRKHLKITIRRAAILVEDLSTYGTLVDGKRLEKNMPMRIQANSKITLCNVDAQLIAKGE